MLSADLLVVASQLAQLGRGRPSQASLRRAVSTAYYAAFHSVVEASTAFAAGAGNPGRDVRAFLSRSVSHTSLNSICKDVAGGNWPKQVAKRLGRSPALPSVSLRDIGNRFVQLQQSRHLADYDTLARFTRTNVLILIGEAQSLLNDVGQLAGNERALFLSLALVGARRDD